MLFCRTVAIPPNCEQLIYSETAVFTAELQIPICKGKEFSSIFPAATAVEMEAAGGCSCRRGRGGEIAGRSAAALLGDRSIGGASGQQRKQRVRAAGWAVGGPAAPRARTSAGR